MRWILMIGLLAWGVSHAQHFRCDKPDTAERKWQAEPCDEGLLQEGEHAPGEPSKSDAARAQMALTVADEEQYRAYKNYCRDLGYGSYLLAQECAYDQMQGIRFLRKVKADYPAGSVQQARLYVCLNRYYNEAAKLLDAKLAKVCYLLP
jgi:hypothetical protein